MAPRPTIRAPTTASIPHAYRIPSAARSLIKVLSRLSRDSLIALALEWLEANNQPACAPYLAGNRDLEEEAEEDYLHTPAESIEELRTLYQAFKTEPGAKRDIVDRILDGDWRRGVSLQQLAMIDIQHLQDHEASLRWTALKLVPLNAASGEKGSEPLKKQAKPPATESFPRMHRSTFLQALKHEISPLVKAHYYLHRLPAPHNLTILRLHVADTPYANPASSAQAHFMDAARVLYIAFPDSCPYVYVALSGSSGGGGGSKNGAPVPKVDIASLKRTVLEAVPKALSRPQQRYALEATALTAKSLTTMCTLRGNGRSGACQGSYSIFADASAEAGPLHVVKPSFESKISAAGEYVEDSKIPESSAALNRSRKRKALGDRDSNMQAGTGKDQKEFKKRKIEVARRFGTTGLSDTKQKAPIDRLHIKLQADVPSPEDEAAGARFDTDANANAPAEQPGTDAARKKKKASVLDVFDSQKSRPTPESQAPPSYLAQYGPNAQPRNPSPNAGVTLTFQGTDVFAGIRTLAELGFMDLNKMPAWMTGEEGVSTATVRNGVVVDGRGGGA